MEKQIVGKMAVFAFAILAFLLGCPTAHAFQDDKEETKFTDQQLEFFETKVRPILVERCYECHEGKHAEGSLNLESRKAILKGGDTGPGIVVGHPDESIMIDAINYGDYEMPPESKLPQDEIDILTRWVKEGAPWPSHSDIEIDTGEDFDVGKRKLEHWCWQPVVRPDIPSVPGNWATDDLDKFILKQVIEAGLTVADKADRATLLRRVSFDLIGLPPTKEQIQQFVVDQTIDFTQVVDQLLASPHFGERWARHWMDLTRFAETCGHEFDYPIPHAYQYRDYLIRAFNADVPYDQFVREHIAGDLIRTPRRHPTQKYNESILGTGFWFLGEATHGPVDVKGDEAGHIDNRIDVMCKTFQGLTVACARCHDHKFDAISTKDYYALSGFLQSSRRQKAMLDVDAKIDQAMKRLQPFDQQSRNQLERWTQRLANGNPDHLANYLIAAIEVERSNPRWFKKDAIVLQGESLKSIHTDSGTVEIQEIKPQGKFSWQGNRQNWWRDGAKIGDRWTLEFSVPNKQRYSLSLTGTVARDYGAAQISIDGTVVAPRIDFYGKELGTRSVSLGEHALNEGVHKIEFQLLAPHDDAIKRNMIGIDFLSCEPVASPSKGVKPLDIETVAKERNLNAADLAKLVSAIQDPAFDSIAHPLHAISKLRDGQTALTPKRFQNLAAHLSGQQERAKATRDQSVRFADFNDNKHGWYSTGFAFNPETESTSFVDHNGMQVVQPGVLNSGQFGGKFFGVIRSPTFEITHQNIHIRLKSRDARIRLIVDGYVMDEYNALLFNDLTVKDADHSQFEWRTQSGDIKKYIGHKAYLEIIDHNDGFAAVDEVWFSNGGGPSQTPSPMLLKSIREQDSLERVCLTTARSLMNTLGDKKPESAEDRANTQTWILKHQLSGLFGVDREQNVANAASPKRASATQLANQIRSAREQVNKLSAQAPHPVLAVAMTDGSAENEYVFVRGNHKILGNVAQRQYLEALVGDDKGRFDSVNGSGRMQLVDQLLSKENPLTSRVMVNRIWHHLTGRGIVQSVDNFGVLGAKPTNQALLDYLADEFVQDDWSIKRMVRRIVLSSTYQMSSQPNPNAVDIDPNNELMHRARIRRLQGEVIRDSILFASGELDTKLHGPSVPIHLTPFMQGRGRPGRSGPLDGNRRRSVYIEVRRNFLSPMMLAFDTPIPFNATGRRNLSNVPAQALILMNDPFVLEQAQKWATSLSKNEVELDARLRSVYLSAFGRLPTSDEMETANQFLKMQAKELGTSENSVEVWKDFCHVIFNVKEFIHIK